MLKKNDKYACDKVNKIEYKSIINCLKMDILKIISEKKPFFLCGDNNEILMEIKDFIIMNNGTLLHKLDNDSTIVGFDACVDLYNLSQCDCIIQATKYSSFSTVAAILGNKRLVNYLLHDHNSLIHIWKSLVILYKKYNELFTEDVNVYNILNLPKWGSIK